MAGGAAVAHWTHGGATASAAFTRHDGAAGDGASLARAPEYASVAIQPSEQRQTLGPSVVHRPATPRVDARVPAPPSIEPMHPVGRALRDGMVISGRTPHRLILFTFDDGPDPRYTPRLLDRLDEFGIKAVFFLTADRLVGRNPWERRNQELAREIVRRGHIVGNHTMRHLQLPLLDDAGVAAEVDGAEEVFERVLGERTWLLRPPGGARSARVDALLAQRGYTQVLWNLGTGDFQVRSADDVVRVWLKVLERRERENGDRGGIVLMHDTHAWSVDAFPRIVSHLRERNCELLARGEELYDIVDDPAFFFVPRADASPSDEAPVSVPSRTILEERQRALREETARRCARVALR